MNDIWDSFNIDHEDHWKLGMLPPKENTLYYVSEIHQSIIAKIEDKELTHEDYTSQLMTL